MALTLCHCSSVRITQAWQTYDPLHPFPAETAAELEKEGIRLHTKLESTKDPANRRDVARLADIRFLQGREREAADLYRRALAGTPSSTHLEHRARFGTALLHLEENGEAREVLESVLHESPGNARALLSYAEYQADIIGDSAYAMELLQRAKESKAIFIPPDFEQALEQNLN